MLLEQRAIAEAGQSIVEGKMGDAPLALRDFASHAIEGDRKAADLVVARCHDRGGIAIGQPACGIVEPRDGLRDRLRHPPGGEDDKTERCQSEQRDRELERAIDGERARHWILQQ